MDRIVVGVDIGTTKIACFIGKRGSSPNKVKILGFGRCASNGVRYGVVENLHETSESIRKAIEEASEKANVTVEEVYIGVAGMHIHSYPMEANIAIPENEFQIISKEDIEHLTHTLRDTATTQDGEEIIHIFPQSYSVDGQELSPDISPVGVCGKVLKGTFNVVTGNCKEIRKLINSVTMAGYKVKDVILEPVASAYAVLNESDIRDGVALVDIGGGTTDIAVLMDDNVRYTSVLAVAGKIITNDISKECQIVPKYAEKLKVQFGSCLPSAVDANTHISIPFSHGQPPREINLRTLAEIIKPRVELIFDLVTSELVDSKYIGHLVNGIALTGGGANMANIQEIAMMRTGVHCHIGRPSIHLEPIDDNKDHVLQMKTYDDTMYATSIGLVIYGLSQEEHDEAAKAKETAKTSGQQPAMEERPRETSTTTLDEITPKAETAPSDEDKGNPKQGGFRKTFRDWINKTFIAPMDE
ncbi:MAG: cell division protein FtsA [Bacteroidales bacterium]|nr:cell division protein FtsA [Bacteroidales bacterium]